MRTRTYDPFGWRLVELSDPFLNPLRRTELLQDLVTCEAEELARGRRHVTIVHGVPCDLATATLLDDVYDTVRAIAGLASWSRLAGGENYLTITVAGECRDSVLGRVVDLIRREHPTDWPIYESPIPLGR